MGTGTHITTTASRVLFWLAVGVAAAVVLFLVTVAVLAIFAGQVHHSGYTPAH
jgi:hypothetical protein